MRIHIVDKANIMANAIRIPTIIMINLIDQDKSSSAHYIKLHAPWSVLCRLAEELNLRAPLQAIIHHHDHFGTIIIIITIILTIIKPAR